MRTLLALLLFYLPALGFSQDMKDAASDRSSVVEGLCRDRKPAVTKGNISVWTVPSKPEDSCVSPRIRESLVKAVVKSESGLGAGKTVKRTLSFYYAKNELCKVRYAQTTIDTNGENKVTSSSRDFLFANKQQTFPAPGVHTADAEKLIADTDSEIAKLYQSHVNLEQP